jgi:predicted nucleic-acid-binding Zn-ribbon protein
MDTRKMWICPKCGSKLTDEQRVREGCQTCLMIEVGYNKEYGVWE